MAEQADAGESSSFHRHTLPITFIRIGVTPIIDCLSRHWLPPALAQAAKHKDPGLGVIYFRHFVTLPKPSFYKCALRSEEILDHMGLPYRLNSAYLQNLERLVLYDKRQLI